MEGVVSGILLLLSMVAAAAMVWTRLQAGFDQPTFDEMIAAIDENSLWYNYHGVARMFFGGLIIAAASLITSAMALARGWQLRVSGPLLSLGGIAMVASGVLVIFISGVYWTDIYDVEQFDEYRSLAGSIGNTFIGTAILLLTPVQWRLGGLMKVLGGFAPIAGISMILVWWDAPEIHRVSGFGFLFWTLGTSLALIFGWFGPKKQSDPNVQSEQARRLEV